MNEPVSRHRLTTDGAETKVSMDSYSLHLSGSTAADGPIGGNCMPAERSSMRSCHWLTKTPRSWSGHDQLHPQKKGGRDPWYFILPDATSSHPGAARGRRGAVRRNGTPRGQGGGDGGTHGATEHRRANTAVGTDGRGGGGAATTSHPGAAGGRRGAVRRNRTPRGQGRGDGGTQGAAEHRRGNTAVGTDGRGGRGGQHGGVERGHPAANGLSPKPTGRTARGRGTIGGQRGAMRRHHGPR